MPFRIFALLIAFVFSGFLHTSKASTLNLAEARAEGAVLAEALAFGEQGDWAFAEELAGRSSDLLIRDVVLWRKLRAGAGSMAEYADFTGRRASWPGQKALAQAVLGNSAGSNGLAADGLSGVAAANWKRLSKLWHHDKFDAAENLLARISSDPNKLGVPLRWAKRRAALARRAARSGRADLGYTLASQHGLDADDGYQYSNLEWIAGWIALRRLGNPVQALVHFQRLNASVSTPISLGRGGYWLGRAYEAMGDPANASEWYRAAAKHPTSFYGQLAAAKLGVAADARLASADLPDWEKSPALRTDDVRLGVLLHFAGEDDLALQVFAQLGRQMQGNAALGALGALTLELGQPHYAVRVAKKAARRGVLIYPAYYPVTDLADYASRIEPALAMSISRQETELNPRVISPAGARGLMQLMPRTAKKVASQIGEPYSRDRLLDDWQYNARLGQAYLAEQVQTFGGSYVLAAVAYNAGPSRADAWIGDYGDPRLPGTDIIDWIETIPFNETRNYVQRVIEGLYVYRARIAGVAGPMTIEQDLARGVR